MQLQPNWQANSFMGLDAAETVIPHINFPDNQLLALAYFKHVHDQVKKRKFSFMGSIDGRHRAGKSIFACSFGYLMDNTFWPNFEARIVQDHVQFGEAIENIAREEIEGAVVMVDEAGTSMASSDWYERWLKALTKMVQIFGYLHPIILFVAPVKDFVDSRLRKMFHGYYKLSRYTNEFTSITPYDINFNTVKGKWFYKKPIVRIMNREVVLRRILFSKPAFIVERYAALEQNRKAPLMRQYLDELKKMEITEARQELDFDKMIAKVVQNHTFFQSKQSKSMDVKLDQDLIQFQLKLTNRQAKVVKLQAERLITSRMKELAETIVTNAKGDSHVQPVQKN